MPTVRPPSGNSSPRSSPCPSSSILPSPRPSPRWGEGESAEQAGVMKRRVGRAHRPTSVSGIRPPLFTCPWSGILPSPQPSPRFGERSWSGAGRANTRFAPTKANKATLSLYRAGVGWAAPTVRPPSRHVITRSSPRPYSGILTSPSHSPRWGERELERERYGVGEHDSPHTKQKGRPFGSPFSFHLEVASYVVKQSPERLLRFFLRRGGVETVDLVLQRADL
jgi:hypothetical protein